MEQEHSTYTSAVKKTFPCWFSAVRGSIYIFMGANALKSEEI